MEFLTEAEPARGIALPVRAGIRRVVAPNPGPMTYWGTNTYLIETPDGLLVLDPGPDDAGHVAAVLDAAAGGIAAILVSHSHHDHIGALPALRAASGAPVHAWHDPADPAVRPEVALRDGDRVGGWQALHTPGHAADHLCFAGPDGVLFSGDHVMGWSTSVVGPPGGSMADYFASLRRLLDRGATDELYLPGHGPALAAPARFVEHLLAHRGAREAALLAALGPTPQSVSALTLRLYADVAPALRRAAERNVGAHLQKLRLEGFARETDHGWSRNRVDAGT